MDDLLNASLSISANLNKWKKNETKTSTPNYFLWKKGIKDQSTLLENCGLRTLPNKMIYNVYIYIVVMVPFSFTAWKNRNFGQPAQSRFCHKIYCHLLFWRITGHKVWVVSGHFLTTVHEYRVP